MFLRIADFTLGEKHTFIIAEIGNNHNGSFNLAIEMVDAAIDAGADCVKFQMRNMDEVYRQKSLHENSSDLGTEYILDLLSRFELTKEEHEKISRHCSDKGILYLCTPWDKKSVGILETFNVPAYKVASADLTNLPLLENLADTHKPLIISTGMSTRQEVEITVDFLRRRDTKFALLHCNSTYPAPLHDINLLWLSELKKLHPLIGYSGHERGIAVSLAAVALGAKIIERHFTFDRKMEGPDHAASLEPDEFTALVKGTREIEEALGSTGEIRTVSQGEMINRENLAKSLVAAVNIKTGTIIKNEHVKVLSPGQGLSAQNYEKLIGKKITRDMLAEDYFYHSDLNGGAITPRSYRFNRPWGIPVRYHDFNEYSSKIDPPLWEFHLSYSDLKLDPSDYFWGVKKANFVVHAPELFENSKLMDLATSDETYRKHSLKETQRVIDLTRELKRYFPNTEKPLIVTNIGGFTMDAPLNTSEIEPHYFRFAQSLDELDIDGVEIIPQTMAPFPWHFGGQRYQNLFVKIEEIIHWCEKLKLRMCFDTSHTKLTCNHFNFDFYKFAEMIAPYTAHIHFGDAQGVNGEGLQIGDGDIDFVRLGQILAKGCPEASFIPEIWQGHKNHGAGFWTALEQLEQII